MESIIQMFLNWQQSFAQSFIPVTRSLMEGFGMTFKLFCLTLLFALPLGLIISFGSMSRFKPLKWLVKTFVWIIRGTPLMLQLIVVYYGPGLLFNLPLMERFSAALLTFVINYACYFESVSRGQHEAGQVLGMTKTQVFFRVILLQVIKRIVPPMSNEIITLVKDTSLARIIAVYEIIWSAERFVKLKGLMWPLFYTGAFYLLFSGLLSLLFGYIEKKMSYFRS